MVKEKWLPVLNYEGVYEVSNNGNVRSLPRKYKSKNGVIRRVKGSILTPLKRKDNYIEVKLSYNGVGKSRVVHQLVAEAFLGHRPDGTNKLVVNHINFNRSDNRLKNLEVITNRKNSDKAHLPSKVKSVGVSLTKNSGFKASIRIDGDSVNLGVYNTEYKASAAYTKAVNNLDKYNGDSIAFRKELGIYQEPIVTSKCEGVSWNKQKEQWKTQIRINGKQLYLGMFNSEEEASKAYELASSKAHLYKDDLTAFRRELSLKKEGTSKAKGVSFSNSKNKWVAQGTKNYKNYLIGRFKTEEEAIIARENWVKEIRPTL